MIRIIATNAYRGLVRVLKDLDGMGYNTARGVFGAEDCKAPHSRKRIWIVANADNSRQRDVPFDAEMACTPETDGVVWPVQTADLAGVKAGAGEDPPESGGVDWWPLDFVSGMDDGVASRMERIRATGNGQVPTVVRLAWETLRPWA